MDDSPMSSGDSGVDDATLQAMSKLAAHDAMLVHAWLKSALEPSLAAKNAYAFKNRIKPFNEIIAKVQAKRRHEDEWQRKPAYAPADLTDISGFRIVSLFNAEIPVVLGHLLDLLETPVAAGSAGAFREKPVEEVIFFSSRREGDPLSIIEQVRKIVIAHGYHDVLTIPHGPSGEPTSSYSSVHVIVRSQVAVPGANPLVAASEIQLRSVFEEAWGEINHRLKYAPAKRERARAVPPSTEADDFGSLWLHLDALKSLTDGCAQYADLINLQLADHRAQQAQRLPQPTDSAAQLLETFRGCSTSLFSKVERAVALRTQATTTARRASETADTDSTEHKRLFLEAGRTFNEAAEAVRLGTETLDDVRRRELEISLLEEVAYCYLFSGNSEMQVRAETIYEELVQADPNNVEALARLAQIKRDARNLDEARVLMETALEEDRRRNPTEHRSQIRWLLCRNLAVWYREIFESDRSSADATRLLDMAVSLSEQAIVAAPTDRQRHGASLNLLYYLGVLYSRAAEKSKQTIAERALPLLSQARDNALQDRWPTANLDILMSAESTFGTAERAKALASTIVRQLRLRMEEGEASAGTARALSVLPVDEQDIYLSAMELLAGPDSPPSRPAQGCLPAFLSRFMI
jgi:ppGpp synthetase/RelA/SpoT-type nucleotidyltranferase